MPAPALSPTPTPTPTSRLVSADGVELPLRATDVLVRAGAGAARVTVRQTFVHTGATPIEVTYQLPLPADGAVGAFAFTLADRRVVGRIEPKARARELYDRAMFEGRTAALLDQERDDLFVQRLGNVPPGATVEVEVVVDQPLRWVDGQWEWRLPTVVPPRYCDAATADAATVAVDVADRPLPARLSLRLEITDVRTGLPTSPSHALDLRDGAVVLADGRVRLDRDVVIRWPVAAAAAGVSARTCVRDGQAYVLATVVPPGRPTAPVGRDLTLLLDTSGSMGGEPLRQAVAVSTALIDSLGDHDTLEIIAFGGAVHRWRPGPVPATASSRADARAWLARQSAAGGTPMDDGIREALRGVRAGAQRQIVLVTDGWIGFEQRIVELIRTHLPTGPGGSGGSGGSGGGRLHTVGIGSAPNRGLLVAAARAGAGREEILGVGEAPGPAAARLVARLDRPQVVDLQVDAGASLAARAPDLYAGEPACVLLRATPGATVTLRGRTATGGWCQVIEVPTAPGDDDIPRRWARERVADLEVARAAGVEVDAQVLDLGVRFGIVTRLTSFVAVSDEVTVDPTAPTRQVVVPHELPAGTAVEGLGLRPVMAAPGGAPPLLAGARPAPMRSEHVRKRSAPAPRSSASPRDLPAAPSRDEEREVTEIGAPDDHAPPSTPPAPAPPPGILQRAISRLFGVRAAWRIVRAARIDGRLVIELEALHDQAWDPSAPRRLAMSDGRQVPAVIDRARSTPATTLTAGHRVRLAIDTAEQPVALVLPDGTLLPLP